MSWCGFVTHDLPGARDARGEITRARETSAPAAEVPFVDSQRVNPAHQSVAGSGGLRKGSENSRRLAECVLQVLEGTLGKQSDPVDLGIPLPGGRQDLLRHRFEVSVTCRHQVDTGLFPGRQ